MSLNFEPCNVQLNAEEMPAYPCVKKALGLNWNDEYIKENAQWSLAETPGALRQYVEEYCYWVYNS